MTTDDDITISRAEWDTLMGRLAALEARPTASPAPVPSPLMGRRRMLTGLAGAAGAGLAATVATASPVAAADNDAIKAGVATAATNPTTLTYLPVSRPHGFGVIDGTTATPSFSPALYALAKGQSFNIGLGVQARGDATGILVQSEGQGVAVISTGSAASVGGQNNSGGTAILAASAGNQLVLNQGGASAPPQRPGSHVRGAIASTAGGDLWYCGGPTASAWRKLSGTGTAGALHVLPAPARIHDSRVSGGILGANGTRVLDLKAAGSGVPAGATAALLTVLLVNATSGNGNATVWANGVAKPLANTLVWGGTAGRFTATAVSSCDAQARVQVHASLATHVVVDVVGYYR